MCSGQARPRPPRSHDGAGPHPNMGGMHPAQPQQQMGVAAMGMYPGVMPYGMMPGMHPQVTLSPLQCLDEDISEVQTPIYIYTYAVFLQGVQALHMPRQLQSPDFV